MRRLHTCSNRCHPYRPDTTNDPCIEPEQTELPRISIFRFDATEGYLRTQEGRPAVDVAPLTCISSHRHCLVCSVEFGLYMSLILLPDLQYAGICARCSAA
jgi:hypothetical protein